MFFLIAISHIQQISISCLYHFLIKIKWTSSSALPGFCHCHSSWIAAILHYALKNNTEQLSFHICNKCLKWQCNVLSNIFLLVRGFSPGLPSCHIWRWVDWLLFWHKESSAVSTARPSPNHQSFDSIHPGVDGNLHLLLQLWMCEACDVPLHCNSLYKTHTHVHTSSHLSCISLILKPFCCASNTQILKVPLVILAMINFS